MKVRFKYKVPRSGSRPARSRHSQGYLRAGKGFGSGWIESKSGLLLWSDALQLLGVNSLDEFSMATPAMGFVMTRKTDLGGALC